MNNNIELNFCEKGTDHSFVINISPTATGAELWGEIEKNVLISFPNFRLEDENESKIELPSPRTKLDTIPQFSVDGALFTYWDTAYAEVTPSELTYIKNLPYHEINSIMRIAQSRPPLMFAFLKTITQPDIIKNLFDADLTELYFKIPKLAGHEDASTNPLFRIRFARLFISVEQRKVYWSKQLETDPESKVAKEEMRFVDGAELIENAFQYANEYNPENFGGVVMLYVPIELNGQETIVFVDSGAQVTLISYSFAKRLKIDHLIDKRFAGKAKGVGSGNLLGLIIGAQIKMGGEFFSMNLQVLDSLGNDFLLGLDNLKRYQMSINLKNNRLEFGDKFVEFLPEHIITAHERKVMQEKVERATLESQDVDGTMEDQLLDLEERMAAKRIQDEKTYKGKSGQVVGSLTKPNGALPTFSETLQFLNENMLDMKRAIDFVSQQHKFKMVQLQREGAVSPTTVNAQALSFAKPFNIDLFIETCKLQLATSLKRNNLGGMGPRGIPPQGGGVPGQIQLGIPANLPRESIVKITTYFKEFIAGVEQGQDPAEILESHFQALNEEERHAYSGLIQQVLQNVAMHGGLRSGASPAVGAGAAAASGQQPTADPSKLKQLVEMGFPTQLAAQALIMYNNDIELAVASLQDDDDEMRD